MIYNDSRRNHKYLEVPFAGVPSNFGGFGPLKDQLKSANFLRMTVACQHIYGNNSDVIYRLIARVYEYIFRERSNKHAATSPEVVASLLGDVGLGSDEIHKILSSMNSKAVL